MEQMANVLDWRVRTCSLPSSAMRQQSNVQTHAQADLNWLHSKAFLSWLQCRTPEKSIPSLVGLRILWLWVARMMGIIQSELEHVLECV